MKQSETLVMVKGRKTITIKDETYHKLAKLGDLSETFDEVIERLIEVYNQHLKEKGSKK